jgi:hypothetical protein
LEFRTDRREGRAEDAGQGNDECDPRKRDPAQIALPKM